MEKCGKESSKFAVKTMSVSEGDIQMAMFFSLIQPMRDHEEIFKLIFAVLK